MTVATIQEYLNAAGQKRYEVRYRKPDHSSSRKRGFKTKRDATEYLHEQQALMNRGQFIDETLGKITVATLAGPWLKSKQSVRKASTYKSLESSWRNQVEPVWGSRRINGIRKSEVQTWVAAMAQTLSATSVIRAYGILLALLDVAVNDRRIPNNDARGIEDIPRKAAKRRAYLSIDQVDALAAEAGDHGTLVLTLAYTGLRWGEATALRLRDFDALRRRLNVSENAVDVNGTIITGTPKTHVMRSVPVPQFLVELLARECEGKTQEGRIFGDGVGFVRQPTSGRGWFESAVRRCQEHDATFPRVTPHDLRHTAASIAISKTKNPKLVQRMLGHKSAAMTLDTYADLFDDDLDALGIELDDARSVSKRGPEASQRAKKNP